MGDKGEHCMKFTKALLFELEQSGWATMSKVEAGCLLSLQDLTTRNQHQVELSKKIDKCWYLAES